MAVASVPSFTLTTKSSPLCFRFNLAWNKPFLGSSYVKFRSPKKNRVGGIQISVCKAASPSLAFHDLDADDFRHPLDKQICSQFLPLYDDRSPPRNFPQSSESRLVEDITTFMQYMYETCRILHLRKLRNTLLLRAIPGLNEIGKALLGSIAEQVMVLENIGTSILVSENQLSELHQLMVQSAAALMIEAPDLYVRQSPVPNAYTLAINGKKPFVVVHTSLIELLSRKELQAVLAHELGHLKCDHGVWLTVANILTLGAYTIPGVGGMIAQSLEEQLFRWLRAAELTCDRAALLVVQDPKVVISVLMKLAGGCPSMADQLNVDAFLEQARSYDKASASPVGWYLRNAQTRQLSHPLPVLRAREIDEWSRSQEYKSLMKRAMQMNSLLEV